MNDQHHALLAYLRAIDAVEILGVFDLTIGRTTYPAVRYKLTREVSPGCPAYDRGERVFVEERFAVAGELPPSYVRNPGSTRLLGRHYRFGDDVEWYVIGHLGADSVARLTPDQLRYHPVLNGVALPNFSLGQWTHEIQGLKANVTEGRATRVEERSCGGSIR